jgi:hypothetical protein
VGDIYVNFQEDKSGTDTEKFKSLKQKAIRDFQDIYDKAPASTAEASRIQRLRKASQPAHAQTSASVE